MTVLPPGIQNIDKDKLMLITILTGGSRGDVQPYIALGLALKRAGCDVRMVTFENYADFVKSYGLDMLPMKGDVRMVASSEDVMATAQADNPLKVVLGLNKLRSYIFDLQKDFFAACAGSDAIVYHPALTIGYFAARQMNIPAILASPFPMTPTREYPALIFYNAPRLGPGWNRLTHRIFEQILWQTGSLPLKEFWKKQFGHTPEHFGSPYTRQVTRSNPTIISCSQYVFPRPADWPGHVHLTGYWFLDDEPGWQPPATLVDFLNRGKPPVYVGFGSIGNSRQAEQTTRLVVQALQRSGQRGLLATGWNGLSDTVALPADMHILESAPHSWLFPRMSAVVHHGGASTTAAGLRAGVPGVIVPHGNDQFAWARRVWELGVAAKPIPRKKLTAEALSDGIDMALSEPILAKASELGQKIQAEDGAGTAARVILDCFG
jgi:sterol 3beta-glucosyltransferase